MGEGFFYETTGGENKTDDWLTPPELIQAAGPFDLDPCAYHKQPWATALKMYSLPEQDGLLLPWEGSVFCNPPYGPEVEKWSRRLALHDNGLLLVFARTETLAFRPVWEHARAILFFYTRIRFHRADGRLVEGGSAPSVLAAARADGFSNFQEMVKFWDAEHDLPFVGQIIHWETS